MTDWTILPGDCRQTMRLCLAPNSIDSIVCDPPYDLVSISKRFGKPGSAPCQYGTDGAFQRASGGFMGAAWDSTGVAFDPDTWREAWRVLKPGGHLIAFGSSRTYHRLACAFEDAGFEIRDQIMWLYGSGFPKSHDVSKGIDKAAGAERGTNPDFRNGPNTNGGTKGAGKLDGYTHQGQRPTDTGPATDAARQWEGWGTALKPAHEPIVLARKPLVGTVAANVLAHGTGAINVDGCRVASQPRTTHAEGNIRGVAIHGGGTQTGVLEDGASGRFPANVMHDGSDEVLAGFPANAGASAPVRGSEPSDVTNDIYGKFAERVPGAFYGDEGSAARFFYCAKASKSDREEGLSGLPLVAAGMVSDHSGQHITRRDEGYTIPKRANHHPTVKPTALMRYLCRLITPPGGTVLDPFAGSGSTGKAALLESFSFIGCEMTPEYIPIAEARLAHALAQSMETPGAE